MRTPPIFFGKNGERRRLRQASLRREKRNNRKGIGREGGVGGGKTQVNYVLLSTICVCI